MTVEEKISYKTGFSVEKVKQLITYLDYDEMGEFIYAVDDRGVYIMDICASINHYSLRPIPHMEFCREMIKRKINSKKSNPYRTIGNFTFSKGSLSKNDYVRKFLNDKGISWYNDFGTVIATMNTGNFSVVPKQVHKNYYNIVMLPLPKGKVKVS